MRFIPLQKILQEIGQSPGGNKILRRIRGAHTKLARMKSTERKKHLERNGTKKWSPLKLEFIELLGKKCWYTEVELIGAPLTIDHFRPQAEYWFLALDPMNYRVACPFANSSYHNPLYGCAGGKGDHFPLSSKTGRAIGKNKLRTEKPVLLDPCRLEDCKLITFQETGRPTVNPLHKNDPEAVQRVNESLLRMNIDHPDFNTKRAQLYDSIKHDVCVYEELPDGSPLRDEIVQRLRERISLKASFSVAATQYVARFRYLDWIENLVLR